MTHIIASTGACVIAEPSGPSHCKPAEGACLTIETGAVIARIFDLVAGTSLEPYAADVAWGVINGFCRSSQH